MKLIHIIRSLGLKYQQRAKLTPFIFRERVMQPSSLGVNQNSLFSTRLLLLYFANVLCTVVVLKGIGGSQINSILVAKNVLLSSYFTLAIMVGRAYTRNLSTTTLITFTILGLGQILGSLLLLFGILAVLITISIFRWGVIPLSLRLYEYPLLLFFGSLFSLINISGMQYVTCFIDKTVYSGNIHHDTLTSASIASMLSSFAIPSTGLHGLPLINYHFLANFFMVALQSG